MYIGLHWCAHFSKQHDILECCTLKHSMTTITWFLPCFTNLIGVIFLCLNKIIPSLTLKEIKFPTFAPQKLIKCFLRTKTRIRQTNYLVQRNYILECHPSLVYPILVCFAIWGRHHLRKLRTFKKNSAPWLIFHEKTMDVFFLFQFLKGEHFTCKSMKIDIREGAITLIL